MIGAFLCALVQVLLSLLIPVLIGYAIDNIIDVGNVHFAVIIKILVLIGVSLALSALFQWFMNVFTRKVSCYTVRDIREKAFENLNRVPLKFIDSTSHGDLMSRLVNDADQVSEGLLQALISAFPRHSHNSGYSHNYVDTQSLYCPGCGYYHASVHLLCKIYNKENP